MRQPFARREHRRLYAILAAEPSGDLHAGALVEELRRQDPRARFIGMGGRCLQAAGVDLVADTSLWGTIGPFEVLAKLPRIFVAYWRLKRALRAQRPDVTVMIDSPALFMRLSKWTKGQGLSSVYYFPPSAWSDSLARARAIAARVDGVVCAFKRQYETYLRAGVDASYFGHPMLDVVRPLNRKETLAALKLPEGRYVALMPGSRLQEIRLMTPVYLGAVQLLKQKYPDLFFVLPAASEPIYKSLQSQLDGSGVILYNGRAHELLSIAEVALLTSGSVTLEAAYVGCPFLIAYRFNPLDAWLARVLMRLGLLKVPHFGLPNLILNERIVTEFLQEEATPQRLAEEAERLLVGGSRREQLKSDLARVCEELGSPPVVPKVARFIDQVANR